MKHLNGGEYLIKLTSGYTQQNVNVVDKSVLRKICETGNVKSFVIQDTNGCLLIPTFVNVEKGIQCSCHYVDVGYDMETRTVNYYETFNISYTYATDEVEIRYEIFES